MNTVVDDDDADDSRSYDTVGISSNALFGNSANNFFEP